MSTNITTAVQVLKSKCLWLWEKIRKYWYLFLFALVAVYAVSFAKNKEQIIENMMRERDAMLASHNARIQDIQAGIEAERKRREEVERSYNALIKNIEETKNARAQEILAANKEQLRTLIERNRQDPQAMAEAVNRLFGITIVSAPVLSPPPVPAEDQQAPSPVTLPENPF